MNPRVAGVALLSGLILAGSGCSTVGEKVSGRKLPFNEVKPAVAFEMLRDNPGLPVIDLRSSDEYGGPAGHLRGALNVPLSELPSFLEDLDSLRNRTFLVYCDPGDCGRNGLELLKKAGFSEVVLMAGGLDGWAARGFGTVTGPPPPWRFDHKSGRVKVD